MKTGIKGIAFIIVLSVLLVALPVSAFSTGGKNQLSFLICGADDAAENTDVLCILNYDKTTGAFVVYQIPRDTYIDGGRINSIYPTLRAKGYSENASLKELCDIISDVFAIDLDGYIGITTETFKRIVRAMGGVYITVDEDVRLMDGKGEVSLYLHKGENLINDEEALRFIRYRTGYIRADLHRMEMQRIFMRGIYDTGLNRLSYASLIKVAINSSGVITNASPIALASIISKKKNHTNPGITAQTLPGEAILADNGAWYYVINRKKCIKVLSENYKTQEQSFDKERRLVGNSESFKKIYYG